MKAGGWTEWLRLFRLHSAALAGLTPVFGALMAGCTFLPVLVVLFTVGVLMHAFGFSLNELSDIETDSLVKDFKYKPLVKGSLSRSDVWRAILLFLGLGLTLGVGAFPRALPAVVLAASFALAALYNQYSKSVPFMELLLALWWFSFYLFGALAVSTSVAGALPAVGLLVSLLLVLNIAGGGLKDIDHDHLAGGRTTPYMMGVRVREGRLRMSGAFAAYIISLHIAYLLVLVFISIRYGMEYVVAGMPINLMADAALYGIASFALAAVLLMRTFDRRAVVRNGSGYTFALAFVAAGLAAPVIGPPAALLLSVLALAWFVAFSLLLYRRPFPAI